MQVEEEKKRPKQSRIVLYPVKLITLAFLWLCGYSACIKRNNDTCFWPFFHNNGKYHYTRILVSCVIIHFEVILIVSRIIIVPRKFTSARGYQKIFRIDWWVLLEMLKGEVCEDLLPQKLCSVVLPKWFIRRVSNRSKSWQCVSDFLPKWVESDYNILSSFIVSIRLILMYF